VLLLRDIEVYAPEPLGRRDVLVAGERVVAVGADITAPCGVDVEVVDGRGLLALPGLIDGHVHIAGAGGEGGPATRTPELQLGQLLAGGITSVIGMLGCDGFTRSPESLLMKAKALRAEGVSCWILTGSYQVPTPTLLGDVGRDLALIDEVIGVGEIAVADHRSSWPTADELARLAGHARVGAMLGGKAGLVTVHVGDAPGAFDLLREVARRSSILLTQFLPTHCNRSAAVFAEAQAFGRDGGRVDLTASDYPFCADEEVKPAAALAQLLAAGVPPEHVTMSSDACGSLPTFDADGELLRLAIGEPASIHHELVDAVRHDGVPLDTAVRAVSTTVADIHKLPGKGRIAAGADADLLLLDADTLAIRHLLARGQWMVRDGEILRRGTFEMPPHTT
jgi:beta-aspartyl-dipeptidase (metallo-type)